MAQEEEYYDYSGQREPDSEVLIDLKGEISGHNNWITCIATTAEDHNMLVTGSRDKTIIIWKLEQKESYVTDESNTKKVKVLTVGKMVRRLVGHNHFISDVCISSDRQYALSASWDSTLRLWNLKTGDTAKRFVGHKKDVLSAAFSPDNKKIVSSSRDHTINVFNTIGISHHVMNEATNGHTDWVTCVRFSPNVEEPVMVSAGRDKLVKVWEMTNFTLKNTLKGHKSYVNAVTISPDGSLCASGGKDGVAMLWDLNEGKSLSSLDAGGEIYALCFSPNRYWLCGAVGSSIKIWDLETKLEIGDIKPGENTTQKRKRKCLPILCTCLAWSQDGKTLYAGHSDSKIRVWSVKYAHEQK